MSSSNIDTIKTEALTIAENTFWVGERPSGEILYANPFLRSFLARDEGKKDFHLLFDPSSSRDFNVVLSKIVKVLGSIDKVSAILLNHQDPDISASVALLLDRYIPNAPLLCSSDTGELVHNYHEVSESQFIHLEKYPVGLKIPSGHVVIPIATPFSDSRGATMLYDPETRILFSGVLFSSLTDPAAEDLFADQTDWIGMRAFHQLFVPTRAVIEHALEQIGELHPPVEFIAPQHGRLIKAEFIETFMVKLSKLSVGVDLLADEETTQKDIVSWTNLLGRVIARTQEFLDFEEIQEALLNASELEGFLRLEGNQFQIESMGKQTFEHALRALGNRLGHRQANLVKYEALLAATAGNLPTPRVDIDETRLKSGGETETDSSSFKAP